MCSGIHGKCNGTVDATLCFLARWLLVAAYCGALEVNVMEL
jgi:hypothetical protein